MSHVPHDAVLGGVVNIVQSYGEFSNAKARSEVSGVDGQFLDDVVT